MELDDIDVISKNISASKKPPTGRTLEYRLYKACERFGQPPEYLDTLDRQAKSKLIAYTEIREAEEIELISIFNSTKR